jgi:hypothetical protein
VHGRPTPPWRYACRNANSRRSGTRRARRTGRKTRRTRPRSGDPD